MAERERRKPLLKALDLLFKLEESGWPVPDYYFLNIGDLLGSGEGPKYKNGLSPEEFEAYVATAKKNGIPIPLFKSRLQKGMPIEDAANLPYKNRKDL